MNSKVKGLLKGLRYISQIFDGKEEQEMQIGYPTDVKHVAHIGWDGPSVTNSPSWMNDFHSAPLSTTPGSEGKESSTPTKREGNSQELVAGGGIQDSPVRDPSNTRRGRRHTSSETVGSNSPSRGDSSSRGSRHSRRHQSAGAVPADSPTRELTDGSRRGRRQPKNSDCSGSESAAQDLPSIPKQSRRRKTKGSDGGGGSTRLSTMSKAPSSDQGLDDGSTQPLPALAIAAEEEEEQPKATK